MPAEGLAAPPTLPPDRPGAAEADLSSLLGQTPPSSTKIAFLLRPSLLRLGRDGALANPGALDLTEARKHTIVEQDEAGVLMVHGNGQAMILVYAPAAALARTPDHPISLGISPGVMPPGSIPSGPANSWQGVRVFPGARLLPLSVGMGWAKIRVTAEWLSPEGFVATEATSLFYDTSAQEVSEKQETQGFCLIDRGTPLRASVGGPVVAWVDQPPAGKARATGQLNCTDLGAVSREDREISVRFGHVEVRGIAPQKAVKSRPAPTTAKSAGEAAEDSDAWVDQAFPPGASVSHPPDPGAPRPAWIIPRESALYASATGGVIGRAYFAFPITARVGEPVSGRREVRTSMASLGFVKLWIDEKAWSAKTAAR